MDIFQFFIKKLIGGDLFRMISILPEFVFFYAFKILSLLF